MFFQGNEKYNCATYLRLSRSDGDQQESNSIKNQRALLNDYMGKHPELHKFDEYVDDGYSGTNFERPDFKRMMQDIEKRNVNCIIVKDLSRFGRNYIETGRYLERIFPFMGVRFIAINDHYDSAEENDDKGRILIPFNNLINDTYCRDISLRVRSHLDVKRKEGQFIGSFAGYGYRKDPKDKNHLLMGSNPIIAPDSEMLWNAAIVWRILRRYEYTGALVMGRRKKIDVNTTSVRTLPEDRWIIAENAHAAIVTKDEYYQAQKAIRNVTPIQYKVGDEFALKGKICCGNCNRQLRHERQYGEMVFYCGYKRSAGKFSKCYGGYYREYSVNAKVARAIKTVFYALDVVNQGMQEKQSITVRCMDIEDLEKQAEAIRVEQIKLYESYADGVLLRDAYIEKKKALSEKLAALQDSIRIEKEEQECADELDEEIRALTKQASEKTYIGGLTKECVDAFVSMVYLYDDQTMKIEFNCEDVIRRALEKYGA